MATVDLTRPLYAEQAALRLELDALALAAGAFDLERVPVAGQ